jgi:predicted regulator of Ras-like GTPase activity (Roadblock/LC7/MglB family)
VDAAQALADLTEISSQIEAVVIASGDGSILGSTPDDEARAQQLAEGGLRLLEQSAAAASGHEGGELTQLEAATPHGSVFVVRDAGRTIVATTGVEPTVGLVFYDLKSCLRSLDADESPSTAKAAAQPAPPSAAEAAPQPQAEAKPKPKPRRPSKEDADGTP